MNKKPSVTVTLLVLKTLVYKLLRFLFRKKLVKMAESVDVHVIGFTGHVSSLDKNAIEKFNIPAPSKFALWLFKETIESEKERRQAAFRQACFDVMGEE